MGIFSRNVQRDLESGLAAFHAVSSEFSSYPFSSVDQLRQYFGPTRISEAEDTLALGDGLLDESDLIQIFSEFAEELQGELPGFGVKGRKNPLNDLIVEYSLNPRGFQMVKFVARGVADSTAEQIVIAGEESGKVFKAIGQSAKITGFATAVVLPIAVLGLIYVYWSRAAKLGA